MFAAVQAPLNEMRFCSAAKAGLPQLFAPAAPFGKIALTICEPLSDRIGPSKSNDQ